MVLVRIKVKRGTAVVSCEARPFDGTKTVQNVFDETLQSLPLDRAVGAASFPSKDELPVDALELPIDAWPQMTVGEVCSMSGGFFILRVCQDTSFSSTPIMVTSPYATCTPTSTMPSSMDGVQ